MAHTETSPVPISLIGLPYHLGVRGGSPGHAMAFAPELMLAEERLPSLVREAFDDVEVVWLDDVDDPSSLYTGGDHRLLPVGDQMSRILVQNIRLAGAVRDARAAGRLPVVSAGTCSASLGMVGGLDDDGLGMIWVDAHSDALTPDTSRNGFIEGMPVSTIAGKCWPRYREQVPGFHVIPEERIVTIGNHESYSPGGRQIDGERALGFLVDPPTVESLGFEPALQRALTELREHTDRVYLHFDVDVMDPTVLRGNAHCAPGGLSLEQAETVLESVASRFRIEAVCFSSFDPEEDERGLDVVSRLMLSAARAAAGSQTTFAIS